MHFKAGPSPGDQQKTGKATPTEQAGEPQKPNNCKGNHIVQSMPPLAGAGFGKSKYHGRLVTESISKASTRTLEQRRCLLCNRA